MAVTRRADRDRIPAIRSADNRKDRIDRFQKVNDAEKSYTEQREDDARDPKDDAINTAKRAAAEDLINAVYSKEPDEVSAAWMHMHRTHGTGNEEVGDMVDDGDGRGGGDASAMVREIRAASKKG